MNVILVSGTRHATYAVWAPVISAALTEHLGQDPATVLHGAAPGIDSIAAGIANRMREVEVIAFPADWSSFGNSAGPKRNADMLKRLLEFRQQGDDVFCLAFHDDPTLLEPTTRGGTAGMVRLARRDGVPVRWYRSDGTSEVVE